jgi:hypothetical protein
MQQIPGIFFEKNKPVRLQSKQCRMQHKKEAAPSGTASKNY